MHFQRETSIIYPPTGCCLFKNLGKLKLYCTSQKLTQVLIYIVAKKCLSRVENADVLRCGYLGGRLGCITIRCRGVRSLAVSGQFCPTISIKLSTVKVRRSKKCGGIRGTRITTGWDTPGYLPCECRASLDLGCRSPKTHLTIVSGEVRRSENPWRAGTTPKFNCIVANRADAYTARNSADTLI